MLQQTFSLWRRFWPQLACLYLLEQALHPWILRAAVEIGLFNRLLGLTALAALVLLKLVVLLWMFHVVSPGLTLLQSGGVAASEEDARSRHRFTAVLALALVPFFAYYTAWGFLGDLVRDYSLLGLRLDPFGERGPLLRAGDSQWLLAIVVASWLLRKACEEQMRRRSGFSWRLAAILLSANWVFIGLYALGAYKEEIAQWLVRLPIIELLLRMWLAVKISAPSLSLPAPPMGWEAALSGLRELLSYVLLPIVWLALAAIIYYGKTAASTHKAASVVERTDQRYMMLSPAVRKALDGVIGGFRTRYLPMARAVELTLTSGIAFLLLFIVSYRVLTWGSACLWILAKHWIGPHPTELWFAFADVLGVVIGNPLGSERGVIFEPLRICLLAAALDRALAQYREDPSEAVGATNVGSGSAGTAVAASG